VTVPELAGLLVALGCPAEKAAEMAAQLDKRAHQLAEQKHKTYDESLAHLLNLMKQGWAAQQSANRDCGILPWRKISSRPAGDFGIFSIRSERKQSPRTGREHEFVVLDAGNWVNVVAVTPDHFMVLVEQYRHGSDTVELEIPGGMIDASDASPEAAGCRELREETGYEGAQARIIGQVFPNPAIMSNTCFTVLVENCRPAGPVQFDSGEDLITRLVPVAEVAGLVASGKIRHSLVIAALYHFELAGKTSA
jgi:8-oxo-dGTP pyrophosphatase MutT (NUDIX family)